PRPYPATSPAERGGGATPRRAGRPSPQSSSAWAARVAEAAWLLEPKAQPAAQGRLACALRLVSLPPPQTRAVPWPLRRPAANALSLGRRAGGAAARARRARAAPPGRSRRAGRRAVRPRPGGAGRRVHWLRRAAGCDRGRRGRSCAQLLRSGAGVVARVVNPFAVEQ